MNFSFSLKASAPQNTGSTINQPILTSEVSDIDQPVYDWGIESKMEQYYTTTPITSTYVQHQQTVQEVSNISKMTYTLKYDVYVQTTI